ncbi:hypothetical protein [Paenibacillus pabuli]|uniref:hypothetical protein n=1 Tax=Paenibacillus pabuli TaxID=1472 RepID=UPI000A7CFEE0
MAYSIRGQARSIESIGNGRIDAAANGRFHKQAVFLEEPAYLYIPFACTSDGT